MSKLSYTTKQYIIQKNKDLYIQEHMAHTSGRIVPMKIYTNKVKYFNITKRAH